MYPHSWIHNQFTYSGCGVEIKYEANSCHLPWNEAQAMLSESWMFSELARTRQFGEETLWTQT